MSIHRYEQLPYPGRPYAAATPERLEVIGKLFGLDVAPASQARVLELGCGSGGHLIPCAARNPSSRFVGIDGAEAHIEAARQMAEELGLQNVEFIHRDLLKFNSDIGCFDYVIAHGLWSWTSESVRSHILSLSKSILNKTGLFYVSYNAFPGWHARQAVAAALRFHVDETDGVAEQIEQARRMLAFLEQTSAEQSDLWAEMVRSECRVAEEYGWEFLFHDLLNPDTQPFYFEAIAKSFGAAGLTYLAEANLSSMLPENVAPRAVMGLERLDADWVSHQQYLDFVVNRSYRASLFHPQEGHSSDHIESTAVRRMGMATTLRRVSPPETGKWDGDVVHYRADGGPSISSDSQLFCLLLDILGDFSPSYVSWTTVAREAGERGATWTADELAAALSEDVCMAYTRGLIDLWPAASGEVDLRAHHPCAEPLPALQARHRGAFVSTRLHQAYEVDELDRQILLACDGRTETEVVIARVVRGVLDGDIQLETVDLSDSEGHSPEALIQEVAGRLTALGRVGALLPTETR